MSGGLSQQFCVRWNSHLGSLGAAFPQLLAGQRFVDVTLACEGHQVHCHRLVLAACSSYFESLLGENPCKHPIIILPRDIKLWEIQALVDFMYKGEVNVSQAGLPDLLKCAEILQIRGLCGSDAALNLNQVSSNTSNSLPTTTTNLPNDNQNKSSNSKANFTSTPNKTNNQTNLSQTSSNNSSVSKSSNSKTNDSQASAILSALTNHSPKTETTSPTTVNQNATTSNNLSIDSPMISIPLLTSNASCISMDDCEDSLNGSTSEVYVDDPDIKLQEDYSNDGDAIVKLEPENKQPSSSLFFGPQTGYQQETSKFGKIRVKSRDNLFENYNSNKNYHPSTSSATYNLVVNEYDDSQNFVASPPSSTSGSVLQRNIQIIENELLPPSLKFNKNSMTIFVKKTNDLNDSGIGGDTELIGHHTTEVDANNSNENLYENIVCSPNLLTLSFDEQQDLLDINSDQGNSIVNSYLTATSTPRKIDKKRFKAVSMDENGFEMTSRSTNIVPPLLKYDTSASNKQLLKELKRQDEKLAIESSLLSGGPPPESFVLRNPRGNQPRTYNTDALWAALMNVKSGESIYRASRIHNVPRKTLRNWMKRWDIKSAYPMPRQLKQAAEKRKAKNVCDYKNEMLVKLAMANVTCEYEGSTYASGRRVRRSETLLRQAAECVSRGQTFQTVSDMFHIPISTIRFFMARKGILPRRKRGRASGASSSDTISLHLNSEISRKSQSNRNTKNFPRNIYKAVRFSSSRIKKEYDKDVVGGGVGGRRLLSEQDFFKSVPWVKLGNHRFHNDKSLDGGSRLLGEKDFFKSMPLVKLARIKI